MPSHKKNKQRRHIRYAINLPALLVVDAHSQYQCHILDFCSHGLFLKLSQADVDIPIAKAVKIEFSIGPAHSQEQYLINAQVMHLAPGGVGVLIDNMPLAVFEALKTQTPPGVTLSGPADVGESSRIALFNENFRHCLLESLPGIIQAFYEMLPDEAKAINQQRVCFENNSQLDDLITSLKIEIDSVTCEFCHSIVDQIQFITETNVKNEELSDFDRTLSLVEKEDFEDWLHISSIIRKLTHVYEDTINNVTRELSRIFGYHKLTINNPVSPSVLCDCFRELVLQMGFDYKINDMLYSCFGKTLYINLPNFYKRVEQFLLSQASAEKPGFPVSAPASKSSNLPPYQSRYYGSENNPEQVKAIVLKQDGGILQPSSMPQVAGKLLGLLKGLDDGASQKNTVDWEEPLFAVPDSYDKKAVITAIRQLQALLETSDGQVVQTGLTKRLEEKLKSLNSHLQPVSRTNNQSLQVYDKFFETLLNSNIVSADLAAYIEQIHLALLALPLMGDDFLAADAHPAKNILDKISYFDQFLKSKTAVNKKTVNEFLNKLTHKIVQEAVGNPEMLSDIEAELDTFKNQLVKPIEAKTRHIVKAHEGQQRLEFARQTIQNEIDKRIAGKAISTVIPLLLDAGWQHLLVFAELNQESQPDAKAHYLKVIDDLLFWLYEQDSILKIQASSIQTTITYIDEKLQAMGAPVLKRKQVVQELTELLIGVGQPKVRKSIQTVKIPKPDTEQDSVTTEQHPYWEAQLEQLAVGDWLNIKNDVGDFEAMKIIWIGKLPPVFVLLSSDGLKNSEWDKPGLISLFEQGAAVLADDMDMPLTERTATLMLQDAHDTIKFNAIHDPDTQLILKEEFIKQLKNLTVKETAFQHVLCHIEVPDFRLITNICGLDGGKQLLKTIAGLISERIKSTDILARAGDQSFLLLYQDCSATEALEVFKPWLKQLGSSHFTWNEKSFPITLSMGLVQITESCFDIYQLLQQADAACLQAEQSGPNQVLVFSGENENLHYQANLYEWMARIDSVFAEQRLFARCQKISALDKTVKHEHYEILLGITDEAGNIIQPDFFIPAVERCKRMPEIDVWIINSVFDWIENNKDSFANMDGFSINLSGQSINSQEFLDFLENKLAGCGFQPEKIVFEITETIASENLTFTKKFIKAIKQYGCKFSLDDFGSGYSSYAYLKNMDVDYLKIDGAFVKDIVNNPADFAIVKSMNEIAHSLNLKTIAEYVENYEINEVIKSIGVDYGQGYYIHKPEPLAELSIPNPEKPLFYFEDNSFWDI